MSRFDFGHIAIVECGEPLIEIDSEEFIMDAKYFTWGLSKNNKMYLRKGVLDKLRSCQSKLPNGNRFKLWDCYRSREVQQQLFIQCKEKVKREHPKWNENQVFTEARKFIAIPDRPDEVPPHNTGGAVDLTVVNEQGEELNFGTDFDEFSEKCYPFYFHELPNPSSEDQAIIHNRDMLFDVMKGEGFRQSADEWWHYDYGNQLWALELKKPHAIYRSGDALLPV